MVSPCSIRCDSTAWRVFGCWWWAAACPWYRNHERNRFLWVCDRTRGRCKARLCVWWRRISRRWIWARWSIGSLGLVVFFLSWAGPSIWRLAYTSHYSLFISGWRITPRSTFWIGWGSSRSVGTCDRRCSEAEIAWVPINWTGQMCWLCF